jgi:hypothetical protein
MQVLVRLALILDLAGQHTPMPRSLESLAKSIEVEEVDWTSLLMLKLRGIDYLNSH